MRTRIVLSAVCMSLALNSMSATPVLAANVPVTGTAIQNASADRAFVQYLAKRDPRSAVRIGAWQALLSSAPDDAIAEFLTSGFDYAVKLAAERNLRNADFAKRVLATFTDEFSPEVHAAAQYAVDSRDNADRERFANGGFAAAQQRDRAVREASGEQAHAIVEADRAFVRNLAANDPGAQVRVSAEFAVRAGASDADLVDFFSSGWAFGARLDLEAFRQNGADADHRWRVRLAELITDAAVAEKAAKEASSEVSEQAKVAAVRAWRTVGDYAGSAASSWQDAKEVTDRQAANWAAVVAAATAAAGPNWSAVLDAATFNQAAWEAERTFAAEQAEFWNSMLRQARDGEQRVTAGA